MPSRGFKLYLASKSTRRQELLSGMKLSFHVVSSAYHERGSSRVFPEILCMRHAAGKALGAILPKKARFVLGGDTIVWHQSRSLGKPRTRAQALQMLQSLSGKKHAVYTGLALWDRKAGCMLVGCAKTDVWMRSASATWLRFYRDAVHSLDKAGAYAIQGRPKIVRKIRGSYSNVVGLPKELLRKMLKEIGRKSDACKEPGPRRTIL